MTSLRSTSTPARIASAVSALCACALALPGLAAAAPSGQLAFEPPSHDFGLQPLYQTTQASLQLHNEGESPTQLYGTEVTGPDSGAFWAGGDCYYGRTLEPSESCAMQVSFSAYEARAFAVEVQIDSTSGTVAAAVSGEGGRPVFTPAGDPTNFGSVPVGSAGMTKTIDVTNTGNLPGGVFIALISGGAVGSFQLLDENCTNTMIQPGSTCNAQVRFRPIATGAKTARLSLFGEGDGGTQITLTGVGLEPEPEASPEPFAETAAAKSSAKRTNAKAKASARQAKAKARARFRARARRARRARARSAHRRALRRHRRAAVASRISLR